MAIPIQSKLLWIKGSAKCIKVNVKKKKMLQSVTSNYANCRYLFVCRNLSVLVYLANPIFTWFGNLEASLNLPQAVWDAFLSVSRHRGYSFVCKSYSFSSVQKKYGDESSTCSTVDKPPEVEELEVVEEEDSTFPEDCYTESETSTMIMCSV